ncbi:MAG TPA: hypothetical protein VEF76_13340 [Patescibacteria group bacterium]|nr:hypothetical protein [Patescibacteria group bacterium]
MKNTLTTIAAALVMVPALAFAADSTVYRSTSTSTDGYTVSSSNMGDYSTNTVSIDSPSTSMSTSTERTTVKTYRNARSDTEYHANDPIPGEMDTRVFVRERVHFNERNAE